MHCDYPCCSRGDQPFNLEWIHVVRPGINVTKYRGNLLPLERMGRGDEGKSRHYDFSGEAEGPDGDLEGHRAVGHGHAVLNPQHVSNRLFELSHEGAIVSEPSSVQEVVDAI